LFKVPLHMENLALFTRHIAGAMQARAPLPEILRAYMLEAESGPLSKAVGKIAERVESGVPLSAALEDHDRIFPAAYRRLVRLGEQGRALGGIMNALADTLEEGLKTYEYFRRAAIYPLLILILVFLDMLFVTIMIAPKMAGIYQELGARIPGPLGDPDMLKLVMNGFLFLILIGISFLLAAMLGLRVRGTGAGRMMLQLPLVGSALRRAESARFANHLALLLENNIPLTEALGLLADSSANSYVRDAIRDLSRRFEAGEKLGDLLAAQPLFPASMAVMVASAEDQGGLARTLRALGRFHAERTSHALIVLREIFEPVMLLLVGLLVALMMLAIYAPLFGISRIVR
jgi:type II secretory pathway component PulF